MLEAASAPPRTSPVLPARLLPLNVFPVCVSVALPAPDELSRNTAPPARPHPHPPPATLLPEKVLWVRVTGSAAPHSHTSTAPPVSVWAVLPWKVELLIVSEPEVANVVYSTAPPPTPAWFPVNVLPSSLAVPDAPWLERFTAR